METFRSNVPPQGPAGSAAEEAVVLGRARTGDRAAFGRLVELHQDAVYGLAYRLCKGDRHRAEELAQEGFLRALQGIAAFRGDAAFGTWIHRIVLNLHLNRESSLATRTERGALSIGSVHDEDAGPAVDPPSATASPADAALRSEEIGLLRAAFEELDEPRRVVILLRDVEGRSYEEIAALLDLPIGTVRSRLARARAELCRKLGGSGFGESGPGGEP